MITADEVIRLRESPGPLTATLQPVVFSRALISVLASSLGRDPSVLEAVGAGFYQISATDSEGNATSADGIVLESTNRKEFSIVYGNDSGFPDASLTATSSSGVVWLVPERDDETVIHLLYPSLSDSEGNVLNSTSVVNPIFVIPSAVTISGAFVVKAD